MLWIGKTLVDRLVNRFALNDTQNRPGQFVLSPYVAPTTDVDKLLRTSRQVVSPTINVTATGLIQAITPDTGKRWVVRSSLLSILTGTWTTAGIFIGYTATNPDALVVLSYASTGSNYVGYSAWGQGGGCILDEGCNLYISVDTKSVNGTGKLTLFVDEEDAY